MYAYENTHTHTSIKWNIGFTSWEIELVFISAYIARWAFLILFAYFFLVLFSRVFFHSVSVYLFLCSTFSHENAILLICMSKKRTQHTHTHQYPNKKNGNWHEIGLFAVQLSFINCKASTFRLFSFFSSLSLSCTLSYNCPNEWNEMEWRMGNEAALNWQIGVRRRKQLRVLSKLMIFEWREER